MQLTDVKIKEVTFFFIIVSDLFDQYLQPYIQIGYSSTVF